MNHENKQHLGKGTDSDNDKIFKNFVQSLFSIDFSHNIIINFMSSSTLTK